MNLQLLSYVAAGLFLATNFIWTGRGPELNHFAGDADIMPPTFAHVFVLLASLLRDQRNRNLHRAIRRSGIALTTRPI
jgi:hypothetical protein